LPNVDAAVDIFRRGIQQIDPAARIYLTIRVSPNAPVELSAVDYLVEKLCPIQGWNLFAVEFPEGAYRAQILHGKRYTPEEFRERIGGTQQLVAAFQGRSIRFKGHANEVPAPWFSLRELSRFGVRCADIHCPLTPEDLKFLHANSALDSVPVYRPLLLVVDRIPEG
ncbi:uncharacterized protein SCHCODRAFT_02465143, partial [Schizophyllum commune H4-8]|uniref:uncharacterized protein n=1 Tax=Schizophyllum commune (strain H4-8 / FGSC 9210) TaxID=578458 RepID=UPI002160004B